MENDPKAIQAFNNFIFATEELQDQATVDVVVELPRRQQLEMAAAIREARFKLLQVEQILRLCSLFKIPQQEG